MQTLKGFVLFLLKTNLTHSFQMTGIEMDHMVRATCIRLMSFGFKEVGNLSINYIKKYFTPGLEQVLGELTSQQTDVYA